MTNLASLREQKELRYAKKGLRWPMSGRSGAPTA